MKKFDDQTLMAYVDGELGEEESRQVELALADDPQAHSKVEEFRETRAAIDKFADILDEPVPDHLIETIRNHQPRPEALPERPRRRSNWLLLAASLVVGVSLGAIGTNYYMGRSADRKTAAPEKATMAVAKVAELSKALPFPLSLVSRAVDNGSKAPASAREKILAELNAGTLSVSPVSPVSTASDVETLEDLQPGNVRAVMPGGLPGQSTRIRNVLGEFSFAGRTCRIFEYQFQHATEASVLIACKKGSEPWEIVQKRNIQ